MIRPLRRAHRRVVLVLTVLLPVLFALALAGRLPEPTIDRVPVAPGPEGRPR
jgi:hypothetical protein